MWGLSNPREEEVYRAAVGYILGSVAPKSWRLRTISVLYREVTRRRLERAEIGVGMTVVDAGYGPGDVALCSPPG